MTNTIKQIRHHNFMILIDEAGGKTMKMAAKMGWSNSTASSYKLGRVAINDTRCQQLEKAFDKPAGWMDQDRLGDQGKMPAVQPTKTSKAPVSAGFITFKADGFSLEFEARSGTEVEAELTRLALRIIEIRSR